ncbi:lantibiotic dehydratase [Pseudoalteromonas sp. T1lg65]|uniref:lantibiotic dehydratase n=1 Tax=Pseudoalteromonas sp. T1lg65 TaxID=2077101 RepID=UPI003F79F36F
MSGTMLTDSFFVVRTPKLPVETLFNQQDTDSLLSGWLATPGVMEAIYLASPSLLERIDLWRTKPDSKQGKKVASALLRYLIRMASRPTPFGLFSGIHKGEITEQNQLLCKSHLEDDRKTRLDMFLLSAIRSHIAQSCAKSAALKYIPNPSHYFIDDQCRYIETYLSDETMQYRLSAVDSDEYFRCMLELAKPGKSFSELMTAFSDKYQEADSEDVEAYLQDLIDEGVLVANIPLPLTGESADKSLLESISTIAPTEVTQELADAIAKLAQLDASKEVAISEYKALFESLSKLPVKVQENKLFQADIYRAFSHCELSAQEVTRVQRQLELISQLNTTSSKNALEQFISKFNSRFEGQFVRLDVLLDDESGISVSNETGYEAPLVGGLQLGRATASGQSAPEVSMLDRIIERNISLPENLGKDVVKLTSKELKKSLSKTQEPRDVPYSFATMLSLYQDDNQRPVYKFNGCYGPSAANLLGRFCHLDTGLKDSVVTHLEKEQAHSEEVIFAEVVHLPEGRPGNVIARPHLRQYEIVFMADSSLQDEFQIPLSDLFVWIEGGKVKLWSKRLNKRIIPRLSSAHNYSSRSLSAYKFLCMLQHQEGRAPHFSMPDSVSNAAFTPRVQLDNLILSEKTWRIEHKELSELLNKQGELDQQKLEALQTKYRVDDWVNFAVSDNVLTLNLKNPMMVEILLSESKGYGVVELKEVLLNQFESLVKDEHQQNYANEVIVPMFHQGAQPQRHFTEKPLDNINAAPLKRRFSAGSEWLSLKIYSGNTIVEQLLYEKLLPFIAEHQSLYEKWFFIRYGDPDWHLRLRFYGDPLVLCGTLLPALHGLLDPMVESGSLHKVELMTYEREVERYGGPASMALVESLFMYDSQLIANSCQLVEEYGEEVRWRVAVAYTDRLLSAFAYDANDKLTLISSLREGFGKEFNESSALRKQLGNRFRDYQTQLEDDFVKLDRQQLESCNESQQAILALLETWQQQAAPVVSEILKLDEVGKLNCSKNSLLGSLLHMHNNRIFKAYGREQEFVIHDMVRRKYFSDSKQK